MNTNDLNEDEYDQIRRYEDFDTIDWMQDSVLERDRRLRKARTSHLHQGLHQKTSLPWLWSQVRKAFDIAQTWIVVSLVGVCIGLNAGIASIVSVWLADIKMGYCSDGWWLNQQFCCWEIEGDEADGCDSWHPWSDVTLARWLIFVIFAGVFSFIAAHLVRSLAKYAAGSGISEIKCILAGFIMKGYLGFATFFIKSITLPLVIASGLSVGKEGPSVHVACCIGSLVAGLFDKFSQSQSKMREVVTAASAAGVAVAFGSPIGGVLFSIEEMSHVFNIRTMWRSFFCALMATFTLAAINPFRTGKLVLFQVTYNRDWHFFEIIFFIILGIFGGLYGAFVVNFNLQVAAFRRKHLGNHPVTEAVLLAIVTAMIGYFNHFLRLDMTSSMAILFRECEGGGNVHNLCQSEAQWRIANSLLLATIIRTCLVIISYGCKVPAGIFVPSMAIGATFGRMIGIMVKAMYTAFRKSGVFVVCAPDVPCITPGTYAFLGAAAALSGVMRITVTVVVIMFELTGALTYILPTMIVLLVTKAVGDFLGTNGIADAMIKFNGSPFLEKEDHSYNVSVSEVMRRNLRTLNEAGMRIKDLENILTAADVKGYPVLSTDGTQTLRGYIGRTELRYRARKYGITSTTPCILARESDPDGTNPSGLGEEALFSAESSRDGLRIWSWVNQTPMTVSPEMPLEIVMQLFKRMGPRVILVEDHGKLVGLVTVKDVLRFIATRQPHHGPSWDERGGLHNLLEEIWHWVTTKADHLMSWSWSSIRRYTR
ncbi:Cl-channel protein [Amanita muscaria]